MMTSDTSIDALKSINLTILEQRVYKTIRSFGKKGCISDEIRAALPGFAYSSVTARFKSLIDSGRVRVIGERPGASGRMQRELVAVDETEQPKPQPPQEPQPPQASPPQQALPF